MTVYVDPMMATRRSVKWPFNQSCHMYADTVEELHRMVDQLGMSRGWFQDKPGFPHYDLTPRMREKAVKLGAVETDRRHIVDYMKARRSMEEKQGGE